jgi:hypothetical protein
MNIQQLMSIVLGIVVFIIIISVFYALFRLLLKLFNADISGKISLIIWLTAIILFFIFIDKIASLFLNNFLIFVYILSLLLLFVFSSFYLKYNFYRSDLFVVLVKIVFSLLIVIGIFILFLLFLMSAGQYYQK